MLLFGEALAAATDWPTALDLQRTAFNGFSILHALVKQSLLVQLIVDVTQAVSGYIRAAQAG